MATTPDNDVRNALNTAVAALTTNTNLFAGPERPIRSGIPTQAVFCLATGGPPPLAFVGDATEERFSNVQVMIRSERDDYEGGRTLARAVRDALHHVVPSGYLECSVMESEPNYLGKYESGEHKWTVNVLLEHRQ